MGPAFPVAYHRAQFSSYCRPMFRPQRSARAWFVKLAMPLTVASIAAAAAGAAGAAGCRGEATGSEPNVQPAATSTANARTHEAAASSPTIPTAVTQHPDDA